MLTRKQYELLVFIHNKINETGFSPSFDEMKNALNLRSKSGIHRLVSGLEERGFIRRLAHKARALEVLRLPDIMTIPKGVKINAGLTAHADQSAGREPSTNVIEGQFGKQSHSVTDQNDPAVMQIPLYGRIAAGTPIEALRDHSSHVDFPASMMSSGEHYALEVDGDSMIDAGIFDGDTVLIKRTEIAENGTIVVALVDGEEVTLKRLRKSGASIALEPANKKYDTQIFGSERINVQGVLVGLVRSYQ